MSLTPPQYKQMRQYLESGSRIELKDGTPVKFDESRVKIPTGKFVGEGRDKSQIFKIVNNKTGTVRYTTTGAGGGIKKTYKSIKELKDAKLESLPDEFFVQSKTPLKDGIKEVTYKNRKTGEIKIYYKPRVGPDKATIPGRGAETKEEAQEFIDNYFKENPKQVRVRDPQKDYASKDVRKKALKETDPTKAAGTKKYNYHHIRQIAGGVPLTTDDVMIINQRINSKIGGKFNEPLNRISAAIQKNNRLALEAMNAKDEGAALDYMKKSDDLNAQAEKIVNSAIDDLPEKYKGYVGFNQFTLPRDEYGLPIRNEPMIIRKVGGMPVSKDAIDLTTLNLKQEQEFRKIVKAQAERGQIGQIAALKPGTPLHTKLMKFCPNSFANGGTGGVCSIDEAITGMKNEIQAARTGTASQGALSRTANKFKNIGSNGFRVLAKIGLASEAALEAALGFDRVISEGESPIQALRKSYLTAPLRASGLMKTYEEGQREELLQNAAEKDKVEFVLDQQELINDRNRAITDIQKLKDSYDNDILSDAQTKGAQQEILDEKKMGIKDMYRSGELSRAENLISGFQKPQDLNIKDKSLYDAFINAQEKLSVVNAPKFVASSERAIDQKIKKREEDEGFLNKEKIDELIKGFQLPQKTEETVDLLGGYDQIIKDAGMSAIAEGGGVANLAGGGIAKQAGDSSGPPPESGPNSQGLLSLMKRGMKI